MKGHPQKVYNCEKQILVYNIMCSIITSIKMWKATKHVEPQKIGLQKVWFRSSS